MALFTLLIFTQMNNLLNLGFINIYDMSLMILVLPYLIIKKLSKSLESLAPGSRVGFILMLAIILWYYY